MSQEAAVQPPVGSPPEAESGAPTIQLKAPVTPTEITQDVEPDVLFSDPVLTAWWWDSHAMLTNRQRHELAIAVYPLCTSGACRAMVYAALVELDAYFTPVSVIDSILVNAKQFCKERPMFAALAALGMAGLFVQAGMGIWNFLAR